MHVLRQALSSEREKERGARGWWYFSDAKENKLLLRIFFAKLYVKPFVCTARWLLDTRNVQRMIFFYNGYTIIRQLKTIKIEATGGASCNAIGCNISQSAGIKTLEHCCHERERRRRGRHYRQLIKKTSTTRAIRRFIRYSVSLSRMIKWRKDIESQVSRRQILRVGRIDNFFSYDQSSFVCKRRCSNFTAENNDISPEKRDSSHGTTVSHYRLRILTATAK